MINKLKKNFIITNMLVILIALITIFSYIYFSSALSMKEDSFKLLEGTKLRFITERDSTRSKGYSIVKISVTDQNEIVDTFGEVFLNEKDLNNLIKSIDSEAGTNKEFHVRYVVDETEDLKEYYLIDISFERAILLSLLLNLISIGVVSLVVFLFISYQLSEMMVKPAVIAWDNQKQFISNASHELKTPLTVILANSELLADSDLGSESNTTRIGYVKHEANRMKSLVEEMLFLAKFDEYSDDGIMEQHNISDIIMESILMFDPIAFENQIELLSDIEDDITLECFPNQIKQLNDIFVDNAIKYSPAGEVINIQLFKSKHQVIYSANNTGAYLKPDELDQIFSRFYKTDKARTNQSNSYGLGLAIAQKIVDIHSATINVESTKENGTTFVVKFNIK